MSAYADNLERLEPDNIADFASEMSGRGKASAKGSRPKRAPEMSENELARSFEAVAKDRFVYNHTAGRWLAWNGSFWQEDRTGRARAAIRLHCESEAGREFKRAGTVKGVEILARDSSTLARCADDFDRDLLLLGTPQGTVCLRTGQLCKSKPSDLITRATSVAPASGDCKRFMAFLNEATGEDAELIAFLKRYFGYAATGATREQCFVFFYGAGGTGKSTLAYIVQKIFGTYALTAPMEAFAEAKQDRHPADIAMLANARFVVASETESGRKMAAARIKMLTGSDPITARHMRQDFFTFSPTHKIVLLGNHAPSFEVIDEAIKRRLIIVPFDKKPAQKDDMLAEALAAEAPQILSWIIQGCLEWQRDGLGRPESVVAAGSTYMAEQDLFSEWLVECTFKNYKASVSRTLALASWNRFRERCSERGETSKQFAERMRRAGFSAGQETTGQRCKTWLGLDLTASEGGHG